MECGNGRLIGGTDGQAQEMKRKYLNKLEQMIKNMEDIKPSAKTEDTKYKYEEIQKKLTLLVCATESSSPSSFPPPSPSLTPLELCREL